MKQKLICLLLTAALLLGGCDFTAPEQSNPLGNTAAPEKKVTTLNDIGLLYYPDADPNPLSSTNLTNQKFYASVYLPLITFDEEMNVQYGCALTHSVSGKTIRFSLDTARRFSDGTKLNGQIVKRCFDEVMANTASPYYKQLSVIQSVTATDSQLTITLKEENPGALYAMDIPIVLVGGTKEAPQYLGCGDYKIGVKNSRAALLPNTVNATAEELHTVLLYEPHAGNEITNMFNSGVLDVLPTDLLSASTFSASRDYNIKSYLTDTMIFMGVHANGSLADAAMRRAFSMLIPREEIVKSILMQRARATARPIYPKLAGMQTETLTYEDDNIVKAFTDAGMKAKNNVITTADGKTLTLRLMVSNQNQTLTAVAEKIQSAAWKFGIVVEIESISPDDHFSRLGKGNFDLYLARYTLPADLDSAALFVTQGVENYGKLSIPALDQAYQKYRAGGSLSEYCAVLEREMPVLPIAFLENTLYLTQGITPDETISFSAPLGKLSAWKIS